MQDLPRRLLSRPTTILLGTTNKKKVVELRPSLNSLGIELLDLASFPDRREVEESGSTFRENARLKASGYATQFATWTIGEDSGLCVPALKGEPGVYSARYAGIHAGDEANNDRLLDAMKDLHGEHRAAYYVSTMCLASPDATVHLEVEGRCWGRILRERRGSGGFGYDPLFEIVEYHLTFAELGLTVKAALSHRGRAVRAFLTRLPLLFERHAH